MEFAYWTIGGMLALAVGSFLNVVIYRLPLQLAYPNTTLNLLCPASHCPACKTTLRWSDKIPVVSWLRLRGKCRDCGAAISLRYPLIEIVTAILSLLLAWQMPIDWHLLAALLLLWALLVLALIDVDHLLLPDAITLPMLWIGLLLKAGGSIPGTLHDAVIGAASGYMVLWVLAVFYQWLKGVAGLGMGDAKLVAAIGAWLGWAQLPYLLIIASSGAIVCILISRLLWQRNLNKPLAFGPWIALAAISLFIHTII